MILYAGSIPITIQGKVVKYFIYFIHWCELSSYHTCIIQGLRESRQAQRISMKFGTHFCYLLDSVFQTYTLV